MILNKELNINKLAWEHLGCSLFTLQDLLKSVYERGLNDARKQLESETKSNLIFGEDLLD